MDVLDDARALVEAQLRTLEDEERRLRRALVHLGSPNDRTPSRRAGQTNSRPRTRRRKASTRRAPKGERRDQFMQCVADAGRDGVTVKEIATEVGLSTPNPLHPVGRSLLELGAVSKEGSRFYPVGVKPPEGKAKAGRPEPRRRKAVPAKV